MVSQMDLRVYEGVGGKQRIEGRSYRQSVAERNLSGYEGMAHTSPSLDPLSIRAHPRPKS